MWGDKGAGVLTCTKGKGREREVPRWRRRFEGEWERNRAIKKQILILSHPPQTPHSPYATDNKRFVFIYYYFMLSYKPLLFRYIFCVAWVFVKLSFIAKIFTSVQIFFGKNIKFESLFGAQKRQCSISVTFFISSAIYFK